MIFWVFGLFLKCLGHPLQAYRPSLQALPEPQKLQFSIELYLPSEKNQNVKFDRKFLCNADLRHWGYFGTPRTPLRGPP